MNPYLWLAHQRKWSRRQMIVLLKNSKRKGYLSTGSQSDKQVNSHLSIISQNGAW